MRPGRFLAVEPGVKQHRLAAAEFAFGAFSSPRWPRETLHSLGIVGGTFSLR